MGKSATQLGCCPNAAITRIFWRHWPPIFYWYSWPYILHPRVNASSWLHEPISESAPSSSVSLQYSRQSSFVDEVFVVCSYPCKPLNMNTWPLHANKSASVLIGFCLKSLACICTKDSLCVRVLSWTINSSSVIHYYNLTNLHPIISIIRYCHPFGASIRFNKRSLHNPCHSPTCLRGFKFGLVCHFVYSRSVMFVCVFWSFLQLLFEHV